MPITVHQFAEKVALVINGSDGVGRAVTLQLALQGSYVIVSYQTSSAQQLNALEEMKSLGTLANAFQFLDAKTLVREVDGLFGRLDLLINCVESDADSVEQIQTITNEAVELMTFRPKPTIVNVVSQNQTVCFVENLPPNFRQNCVVTAENTPVIAHDLFSLNNHDDVARVVLFLLSSESKSLERQILTTK